MVFDVMTGGVEVGLGFGGVDDDDSSRKAARYSFFSLLKTIHKGTEALLSSIRRPGVITQHSTPTSRKSITCERPRGVENCTESIENLDPWTLLRDYSMILSAVLADSAAIPFPSPDSSS